MHAMRIATHMLNLRFTIQITQSYVKEVAARSLPEDHVNMIPTPLMNLLLHIVVHWLNKS